MDQQSDDQYMQQTTDNFDSKIEQIVLFITN